MRISFHTLTAVFLALLLCGCGNTQTAETVNDVLEAGIIRAPREISVELPEEAKAAAMESGKDRLFLSDAYEIRVETLAAGDLDATLRAMTGYSANDLTLVETGQLGCRRYDFVWVTQGDETYTGRGAVMDDGRYHYCLSVLRPLRPEETSQVVWSRVFQSFSVS